MRLELALIIGVLFFCCWCAFIIIRMNSSLASSSGSASQVEIQQQGRNNDNQFVNPDESSYYSQSSQVPTNNRRQPSIYSSNYSGTLTSPAPTPSRSYLQLQQPRQPEANAPAPMYAELPNAAYNPDLRPPYLQYPYHSTSSTSWPTVDGGGSRLQSPIGVRPINSLWQPALQRNQSIEALRQQQQQQQAQQEEQLEEVQPDEEGNTEDQNEEEESSRAEEEPQEVNNELEEQVGRRSFSEDQADASERDKDGNVIVTHRRHLINGKPVQDKLSTREDPSGSTIKSKSAQTKTSNDGGYSAADFDRIVDEIDDSESSKSPSAEYDDSPQGTAGSGLKGSITAPNVRTRRVKGARRSTGAKPKKVRKEEDEDEEDPLPKSKKDHREHRVLESLKAQQWDDDAATSPEILRHNGSSKRIRPEDGAKIVQKQEHQDLKDSTPSSGDNNTEPTGKGSAEGEQETDGQDQIEFEDLDLFGDSESQFPFLDGEEDRRRRKRQTEAGDAIKTNVNPTASNKDKNASKGEIVTAMEDLNVELMQHPSPPFGGQLQQQQAVDGLSFPPPPPPPHHPSEATYIGQHQQQPSIDQGSAVPYIVSNGHSGGQLGGILSVGQVIAGGMNSSGNDRIASGSKMKKRTKKKSKKKVNGESKMSEKKHKAAKAYSMKKKSKFKKGAAKKKKKKAMRKLKKSHKEFKGAIRGNKVARGDGQRGGKKGALYYKDKGYKKKGFKKRYQKLETGDHKTYFDEFRDKDHDKKWKDFKDKHHYSQKKKWAGNDGKKYKKYSLNEFKDKKYGSGAWKEKSKSKYKKDYEMSKRKKKRKKTKKV